MFTVLSDPAKRLDYDISGTYEVNRYSLRVTVILDIINFECSTIVFLQETYTAFL